MGAVDSAVASRTLARLVAPVLASRRATAYRDATRSVVVYGGLPYGLRLPPLRSDLLQNGDADTRERKWRATVFRSSNLNRESQLSPPGYFCKKKSTTPV